MPRTLIRLLAATSLTLGATALAAGPAAAEPTGPPGFVTQDRSVFDCNNNPGMQHAPDTARRNLGGRCVAPSP